MHARSTVRWILAFTLAGISCVGPKKGVDRLFPSPGFEKGWKCEGKPRHFSPQTLYEQIDGEAELYISYGFRELASLLYYWVSPEDTFFVVDLYDMGSPLNAFGLYSNFRHPQYQFQDVGAEAFVSDYGMKFYKGNYLVEIKTSDLSERCRRAVFVVAKEIARRIPEPRSSPELLSLLPTENQVPRTLRYVQREMLNQGFLPGGLEARYSVDGGEATGFAIVFASPDAAKQGFGQLKEFYAVSGRGFINAELPGLASFAALTAYHGTALVFLAGDKVGGVQDLTDAAEGKALVQAIHASWSTAKQNQ
jgi:hypothetical protein